MKLKVFVLSTLLLIALVALVSCKKASKAPTAESCYGITQDWIEPQESTIRRPGWIQKNIIISYCCSAPPDEKNILNASKEKFNLIPAWEQGLDYALKHGLKVMLEHGRLSPDTIHSPNKLNELDGLIGRLKSHPALEAYYILDEPRVTAFSDLEKMVAHLREKDPKHLAFINLLPLIPGIQKTGSDDAVSAYRKYVRSYLKIVKPDLLSYDYYHFFKDKSGKAFDDTSYFLNLSIIREAALEYHVPFMNIIQCSEFLNYWRLPNENELRWLVNTTLAYGGRGISYFLYWGPQKYKGLYRDGKAIPLIQSVAKINEGISRLSPILMIFKSIGVYHSQPLPLGGVPLPVAFPIQFSKEQPYVLGAFEDPKHVRCWLTETIPAHALLRLLVRASYGNMMNSLRSGSK